MASGIGIFQPPFSSRKKILFFLNSLEFRIFLGPGGGIVAFAIGKAAGLHGPMIRVLALCVWMVIWWLNEAVRMGVTGLLPIVILPLLGVANGGIISSEYFSDGVIVCWGSMVMTGAIEKFKLHIRIAEFFLRKLEGSSVTVLIFSFVMATGFVSMWMSNTATAALMCPLSKAVFSKLLETKAYEPDVVASAAAAVDLGIAFAATLGGMATLTGTGANLVLQGIIRLYDSP